MIVSLAVALAAYLAVQFTVHTGVEADTGRLRDPIYREKLELLRAWPEYFDPASPKDRTLFLGSSRTQLLMNASTMRDETHSAFNFACAGNGPVANALYYRRLLEEGVAADAVVVELHPAMLAALNPPFEGRWLQECRLSRAEADELRGYGWALPVPAQFRPGAALTAAGTYRMNLLNEFAPVLVPSPYGMTMMSVMDPHGHVPAIEIDPKDRWKFLAQARGEYDLAFKEPAFGGPAVEAVKATVRRAKGRSRVALLLTPESSEFRSWYGPDAEGRIRRFAEGLAAELGVPLVNAHQWLPDDEFVDGHHSLPPGTRRFTARLAEELRALELAAGGRR